MIIFADIYTYIYIILYSRRLVRSIDRKRVRHFRLFIFSTRIRVCRLHRGIVNHPRDVTRDRRSSDEQSIRLTETQS